MRNPLPYSKMLHVESTRSARHASKTRMTFRVSADLAEGLRQLPNQTAFVESVLQEALGRLCRHCHGTGVAPDVHLAVSNFKELPVGRLDRSSAAQLKALVRLGRQLLATRLVLEASRGSAELGFRLAREDTVLLAGTIPPGDESMKLTH